MAPFLVYKYLLFIISKMKMISLYFSLEKVSLTNRNTSLTDNQYDKRTSLVYQILLTFSDGTSTRYEYTIQQLNQSSIGLYCSKQKCRAKLTLGLDKLKTKKGKIYFSSNSNILSILSEALSFPN